MTGIEQQLAELPGLVNDLTRCLTERPPDTAGGHTKPGSKPPLRLDVLHLTDQRLKPGWYGDDPRAENPGDRYGILAELALWTRAVMEDRMDADLFKPELTEHPTVASECAWLLSVWDYIAAQRYAEDLGQDIDRMTRQVKAALGVKDLNLKCPDCADRLQLQAGGQWAECDSGHQVDVGNLAAKQRRRPPIPTRQACEEFGISPDRLWKWTERKRIEPAGQIGKAYLWLPWDVFCLLNPDIVDTLEAA